MSNRKFILKSELLKIKHRKEQSVHHYEKYRKAEELLQRDYEMLAEYAKNNHDMLRRMEPSDVVEGQIYVLVEKECIYIDIEEKDEYFVGTIDEVLSPNDKWEAFCSNDGCRYGLKSCYVFKDGSI